MYGFWYNTPRRYEVFLEMIKDISLKLDKNRYKEGVVSK